MIEYEAHAKLDGGEKPRRWDSRPSMPEVKRNLKPAQLTVSLSKLVIQAGYELEKLKRQGRVS
jgi:hypothetical protein